MTASDIRAGVVLRRGRLLVEVLSVEPQAIGGRAKLWHWDSGRVTYKLVAALVHEYELHTRPGEPA